MPPGFCAVLHRPVANPIQSEERARIARLKVQFAIQPTQFSLAEGCGACLTAGQPFAVLMEFNDTITRAKARCAACAAAAAKGDWSSARARAGIWHKAGMIVVVLVAAMADNVLGMAVTHLPGLDLRYTALVLPVILVWYIFTELGSIAENAAEMGAPVPAGLIKLLAAGKLLAEQQVTPPDDPDEDP